MLTVRQLAFAGVCLTLCACIRVPTSRGPAEAAQTPPPLNTDRVRASVSPSVTQAFVDSLVALPQFGNMQWGVLIVAPQRGDTLAAVNADRLVMPASNMKLITGAVALSQLGPGYQWRTTITRTGAITNGVLRGDLVVAGTGDPSVSAALRGDPLTAFAPLVAALKASGVTRVEGLVRPSSTPAFPGSPLGFGWEWDDLDSPYGAGVSELLFNEAFTDIVVRGCVSLSGLACITTSPALTSPVVRGHVRVVAAGTTTAPLEYWRDSATVSGIVVRGNIVTGDSIALSVSHPETRSAYVAALTEALGRAGITAQYGPAGAAGTDTVVVLQSLPLQQVLAAMQKPSQNQIAEVLFRSVGLQATGVGTPDSARAVVERQLIAWGARRDGFAVRDGSGLSRHDYLSPRTVVQVLEAMRQRSDFGTFYDALPVAGVDGTLRNRLRDVAQGRVRAKTGTIDKARALSGYVTTNAGELLLFSIIANNHTVPNREIERVQDLIVARLLAMPQTTP